MPVNIFNQNGEKTGTIELNSTIFAVASIKPEVIHEVVVAIQSSARRPIAHTKTRGEVRGGGKKPWQQKGTGRARAGSNRSPLWRGGGITFGPRSNRNWELKVNKKVKVQALRSILSERRSGGHLAILEDVSLTATKTKELAKTFSIIKSRIPELGRKLTLVVPPDRKDLMRAGKNLSGSIVLSAANLNVPDLLSRPGIVILRDALPLIEKQYGNI